MTSLETTFEQDLHPRDDRLTLSEAFTTLCIRAADDLQRKGCVGRTIGIKLRLENFHTVTRDLTLASHAADPGAIRRTAVACLRRVTLRKKLCLLGARVSAPSSIHSAEAPQGQMVGICTAND